MLDVTATTRWLFSISFAELPSDPPLPVIIELVIIRGWTNARVRDELGETTEFSRWLRFPVLVRASFALASLFLASRA